MDAHLATGARFIGQRLPRKEDFKLLTGRGTFIDDVVLPGMLHAAFYRSPIAHGMIRSIDTSAALALPGVRAVYTAKDLEPLNLKLESGYPVAMMTRRQVDVIATDRVLYVGDPVAVIIAESRHLAEDAAALVTAEYDELPPIVTIADARNGAAIHPGRETNTAAEMVTPTDPEIERILADAPYSFTTTITHQRVLHSPMEARGVVAAPVGEEDITIHMGSQSPAKFAQFLGSIFSRPDTSMRVIAKDVGGAFGLKSRPWREEVAIIAASLLVGRPVKWVEDRLEYFTSANQAREQECTLRAAFDKDGQMLASRCEYFLNNGAHPHFEDANIGAMLMLWSPYKMPRFGFEAQGLYSNTPGIAAYRGPWAIESLTRETMIDIAARRMGMDPVELRRKSLVKASEQPHTSATGRVLEDVTPAECLEKLLETIDLAAFRKDQAAARTEGRYLGLGIAAYIEPTAAGTFGPLATEVANIRIEPTGTVTAIMGTHSQGQGTQTTMAQIIADKLGVPFDNVRVFEDDSSATGYGAGSGGSRQAVAGGGAAIRAAEKLKAKVRRAAAHLLNANPEAIEIEDGMVRVEGAPEMTRSLRDIAQVAYGEPWRLPPDMEPGLEARYRYNQPPVTYASAAHACFVEVDIETGFVKIARWVCSEDCGIVINPGVVEGQIAGGLAQAIGMVLLEEMIFDAQGNPTAVTFKDYMLPTIFDVPDFEYTHFTTPSKSEGGFRGVGEGGAIIGPPTLINAIHDALAPFGVDSLDLPLTPSKLVDLIEKGRK